MMPNEARFCPCTTVPVCYMTISLSSGRWSGDAGGFTGPAGTFRQRTELTKPQRDILRALKIDAPHLPAETPRGALTDEAL